MTSEVVTALTTAYDDSPLPALAEGLFYGAAPQGTTGDYMTFFLVDSQREYWMGGRASMPTVQFSLWTDNKSPLNALRTMELWCTWIDREPGNPIDITGAMHNQLQFVREHDPIPLRDPDGGYQVFITYRMLIDEV